MTKRHVLQQIMCPPHFLGGGAPVDFGGGAGRGGTVLLASLGSLTHWLALHALGPGRRWGVSAALVGASVDVCSGDGIAEGGAAALASLGSRWGRAADALACPMHS